ncbi:MAG: NUDIX domain-containing protein [Caldilineaceae bacterium]|nr:NUDIX domain-containing protein [Caldilineaceae bacterium]
MAQTEPIRTERRYPAAPLVGVGVVVFNTEGEVLLAQRGRPPRQGEWSLLGGLIDLGETLADAAVREVWEECAIAIEIGGLIAPFEPIVHDDAGRIEYHYVILDYWAKHVRGAAVAQDDADAVAWAAVTALEQFNLRRDTHQMILAGHVLWRASVTESG